MPVTLTASDAESRIIAGRIVQWDSVGNTSAGQTVFLPNSITFSKNTKLVLEHEITKPIGKLMEWSQDETGITASFVQKLVQTVPLFFLGLVFILHEFDTRQEPNHAADKSRKSG